METPNENEESEKAAVELYKGDEETKRVTRTASRRVLAEVNTTQPPLTAEGPQHAPEKRPARTRRKKVVEEPVAAPSKRTTRAASRRAAAAVQVIVIEDEDQEEVAAQHSGGQQGKPLVDTLEDEATPMEEVCVCVCVYQFYCI